MEIQEFLNLELIKTFSLDAKNEKKALFLLDIIERHNLSFYFYSIKKYPRISEYKKIGLSELNNLDFNNNKSLIEFIKGANTNFLRIESDPDNKDIRQLHQKIKNMQVGLEKYYLVYEKFINNKILMKNNNISFIDLFNNNNNINKENILNIIEQANDTIEKTKIESNGLKLMNSIISNKYKFLVNDETINIFKDCSRLGITKKYLQNSISPKLAAMKDSDDFNALILSSIGFQEIWNNASLKLKIKNADSEVLIEDDNLIYVDISTFDQSKELGSKLWCLSREEEYLEDYLYTDYSRLIFRFDTSKQITDPLSKIACLIRNGELISIYDKNDTIYNSGNEFVSISKTTFPKSTPKTISKKGDKYEKLVENDFIFENQSYLNLLNLNRFDIINSIENKNSQWHLNTMDTRKIVNVIKSLESKEAIDFFIKKQSDNKNISNLQPNYVFLMARMTNDSYSYDDIESLLKQPKINKIISNTADFVNKHNNGYKVLYNTESFFETNDIDKTKLVLMAFKNVNVFPSDFIRAQRFNNISNEMLSTFIEIEPDFIKKLFDKDPKSGIILISSENITREMAKHISNNIPKTEEVNFLFNKRIDILSKQGHHDEAEKLSSFIKTKPKQQRYKL